MPELHCLILPTDIAFADASTREEGNPWYVCSRCMEPIKDEEVPTRLFDEQEKIERRYCTLCTQRLFTSEPPTEFTITHQNNIELESPVFLTVHPQETQAVIQTLNMNKMTFTYKQKEYPTVEMGEIKL